MLTFIPLLLPFFIKSKSLLPEICNKACAEPVAPIIKPVPSYLNEDSPFKVLAVPVAVIK